MLSWLTPGWNSIRYRRNAGCSTSVARVDLHSEDLAAIDLRPTALKAFILTNRDALLDEASAVD
jgi:hypothetical protein